MGTEKKTIIFCNNNLLGLIQFRKEVMNHFWKKGYRVVIIVPKSTINEAYISQLNQEWILKTVDVDPNSINPLKDISYFIQLYNIYKDEKPEVIFHYTIKPNIYGSFASRCLGIKNIVMLAGLGYIFDGNSIAKRIGRLLYKMALKSASKVIVLNEANKEKLLHDGYVNEEKLLLLKGGEGVDLNKYLVSPITFDKIRFLMIARVLYTKGYEEFVEAAKVVKRKYPNVEFELLGPIDYTSPSRVSEATIRKDCENGYVHYLGETNDVQSFVKRDDVVIVIPSKYLEGLNRSLIEGCAMGRPIITTNIPGCKETVDDGINGYLVRPGDSEELVEAIIKFIELPKKDKIKMAAASYKKAVDFFDVSKVIEIYDSL